MMEIHEQGTVAMGERKRVALIAHDNCKGDLLDWARFNRGTLGVHELFATGTTGALLASELGLKVTRFLSGPLGGDQQVGRPSWRAGSISSSSSGIRSSRIRTTWT
jgi:methylglyoxal synthase